MELKLIFKSQLMIKIIVTTFNTIYICQPLLRMENKRELLNIK